METTFFKNISTRQWVFGAVTIIVLLVSFFAARALTLSWCLTPLPGAAVNGCGTAAQQPGAEATAVSGEALPPATPTPAPVAPQVELPPTWDGASRVNILVLGLDYLDWTEDRKGPSRSDTMVVLTIDPQSKTAGMISVPRDLWVNIPGFDYAKLNMAYYYGEANKLPGGGPALASKAVERVLGVPIHYYAKVDFMTFVYLVNQIGGIDVYVEKKIKIDPLGPGADDVILPVGVKHLDGMKALAYARQRYTKDGDVDRARRTQQVILAIRDKVMDPANFATLISRAPEIYQTVQSGISTNMTLEDALKMAMLLRDIPTESIKRGVIDYSMVILDNVTLNGTNASIVKPIPDKIRELRDEIFTSGGPVGPAAAGADSADLMRQEGATVIIRNGTYTQGLALVTADYLKTLGVNVISADNASEFPGVTKVIDHRGKPYALRFFRELFKINSGAQIVSQYDPAAPADIEIILGDDWALNNPMP
ncbi:MAG: hypothetical protein OHK0031_06410 [Anaerolineales bacterium]